MADLRIEVIVTEEMIGRIAARVIDVILANPDELKPLLTQGRLARLFPDFPQYSSHRDEGRTPSSGSLQSLWYRRKGFSIRLSNAIAGARLTPLDLLELREDQTNMYRGIAAKSFQEILRWQKENEHLLEEEKRTAELS